MQLGTLTFRLKGRDDGNYDVDDVTLPAELKLGEKDDVVTFKLPGVAVTALWSPKLQTLLGLDASVKDISIADKKSVGSIAGIVAKLVTTDKGNGHYDEAGSFVLSGLKMSDNEKHSVTLGEIAVESSAQNVDVAAMAQPARGIMQNMSIETTGKLTTATSAPPVAGRFHSGCGMFRACGCVGLVEAETCAGLPSRLWEIAMR